MFRAGGSARRTVLCSARPHLGHVSPMVPMATALQDAGHDVHFATGAAFVPRLRALGFPAHPAGISIDEGYARAMAAGRTPQPGADGQPDYAFGAEVFVNQLARATAADLAPILARLRPDLVILESHDVGASLAAELAGIPAVLQAITAGLPDPVVQALGDRLDVLWADHGLPAPPPRGQLGERYLDVYPARLQEPSLLHDPRRLPVRPVPWSEPDLPVPPWVRSARTRPLVFLTLGTVLTDVQALQSAFNGLARLPVDVLVALGPIDRSALGPIPPGVRLAQYVHQADLLSAVDLVVHHGGTGTMLGALVHGLPQLIIPRGADQFWNAQAIESGGLGRALPPALLDPAAVADEARGLLADRDMRGRLAEVRAELAALPAPAELVPELLALIRPRPVDAADRSRV